LKGDRLYLLHIAECIRKIQSYTGGRESFFGDQKTQDAVLRNLQTMAESTQRLSDEFKARHPFTEWRKIAGFRNVLVHDYLGINLERVWEVVDRDLPILLTKVERALEE